MGNGVFARNRRGSATARLTALVQAHYRLADTPSPQAEGVRITYRCGAAAVRDVGRWVLSRIDVDAT
ncbi:hypothetical protein AB0H34_09075 [Saccharopolyspora shandongensis]|uniref:hypothetical protein n=1 Tax=Saccharopolyspora shandongensis TaxID=418495 RepID=UPI0033C20C11